MWIYLYDREEYQKVRADEERHCVTHRDWFEALNTEHCRWARWVLESKPVKPCRSVIRLTAIIDDAEANRQMAAERAFR